MVKILLCFSFVFLGFTYSLSAQNDADIDWRIREVYGDYLQEVKRVDPERLIYLNQLVKERISIVTIPRTADEKYAKLSEFNLFNIYNPDLKRDEVIDVTHFNPLKYDLTFFARTIMIYRIDGTDYVIFIQPFTIGGTK